MAMKIYLGAAGLTFVYLLAFNGFNYAGGNWITQVPASGLAAILWPVYWGYLHWMF